MQRRHYLALCGTALSAGCSGLFARSEREPFEAPTRQPDTDDDDELQVTVEEREDAQALQPVDAGKAAMQFEVGNRTVAITPRKTEARDGIVVSTGFTAPATAEHPARLRATVRNQNDWAETVENTSVPFFGSSPVAARQTESSRREDVHVVLAPTEAHPLVDEPPEWTRGQSGHWQLAEDVEDWLPREFELDAGEAITGEYALLTAGGDGFPTGRYQRLRKFSVVAWARDAPGPDPLSAFQGRSVPPLGQDPETTLWFHQTTRQSPVFLRPSQERVTLPASPQFDLVNHTTEPVTGYRKNWQLYKRHGDGWKSLRTGAVRPSEAPLDPGQVESWSLLATNGEALDAPGSLSMGHLGGGTYAFGVMYAAEGLFDYAAALVEVDAPPVTVEAEQGVSVQQDGETVEVTAPGHDGTSNLEATVLEPASSAETTLVAEQVMQSEHLRNTIPFLTRPNVSAVRYRTPNRHWLTAGGEPFRFTFDGQSAVLRQVEDEQT
ncbi:hypothetical protein [Haloarchaeobius sp. DT45]|uniref:hypothetical protein n=1 Tax=Haloarchaeobius sp. DT45 TaxID=3446116 RepID=UPI003F6C2481